MSQVHSTECYQQRVAAAAWKDHRMHQSDWSSRQSRKGIGCVIIHFFTVKLDHWQNVGIVESV